MVELYVGPHKPESGSDEGPLRGDVVQSCVCDHPGQSIVGSHGLQGDDRLRGIAVAAGGGSQAVADLDDAAIWLAFEADPPDCPPVGQEGDPVVTEWPLLSERRRRGEEAPDRSNVALEREIVRPRIRRSRTTSDNTFGLCNIDRVQLEAWRSKVSHGDGGSGPITGQPG